MNSGCVALRIAISLPVLAAPAMADDCAAIKHAMLNSGHTPHTAIVTTIDGQGNKRVIRQIQTIDNKFVQTADGKWYAMNIGVKDLNDDTSGVSSCRRIGTDAVAGVPAVTYAIHWELEGVPQDQTLWVSNDRVLKSEGTLRGARYVTEYDFSHVTPPAGAVSMGARQQP